MEILGFQTLQFSARKPWGRGISKDIDVQYLKFLDGECEFHCSRILCSKGQGPAQG